MKPPGTEGSAGRFPTADGSLVFRLPILGTRVLRRGPWERLSAARWYPNTPSTGPFGSHTADLPASRLECSTEPLLGRRTLLTEKSHYAIQ